MSALKLNICYNETLLAGLDPGMNKAAKRLYKCDIDGKSLLKLLCFFGKSTLSDGSPASVSKSFILVFLNIVL